MSVPEGQRKEGKLKLIIAALELCEYTITICANQKVFLPEYQNAVTNDLIKLSKDIFIKLFRANNIRVNPGNPGYETRKARRRELQESAAEDCNELLATMQIAHRVFHLKTKRIKYWGANTIEVRNLTRAWIESDAKRYK